MPRNDAFLALLAKADLIAPAEQRALIAEFAGDAFKLLLHLAQKPGAPHDVLGKLWGDSLGVAHVNMEKTLFQDAAVRCLPRKFAAEHMIVPLYLLANTLTVACVNPTDQRMLNEAARQAGMPVSPVFAFPDDITYAIEINYQSSNALDDVIRGLGTNALLAGSGTITEEQVKKLTGEQGLIDLVNGILLLAVKQKASDIHIDPWEGQLKVRYRLDGVLQDRFKLDLTLLPPVVSRLKILAGMNITERRKPLDGRLSLKLGARAVDFRISTVPTIYGEKVVLRVLGQMRAREIPTLAELNLSKKNMAAIQQIVSAPSGVFFVTGPTGSGKTTSLYSVLQHLNEPDVNIMTVEDPVEYRLAGVNQIQVNHSIELDFAAALRAFLRQDPDVILLGEIRDAETAKIAAQAALTGHLVLATMHTNSALQAITRLTDIGVEPYLVAPAIIGVMAQRLVRKVCSQCKETYTPDPAVLDRLFEWDGTTAVTFARGTGCDACHHTGYSGRVALHEIFIISEEIRGMITRGASIMDIQAAAVAAGFHMMHHDGVKKVLRGMTTLEEVERVVALAS